MANSAHTLTHHRFGSLTQYNPTYSGSPQRPPRFDQTLVKYHLDFRSPDISDGSIHIFEANKANKKPSIINLGIVETCGKEMGLYWWQAYTSSYSNDRSILNE